jgi:hypothetical protein
MIDADALLKRMQNDPLFDLVERYGVSGVIEAEPTVEAIPTDWIITYIKAKMDKVAYMVKADGNEHEMGMEIVEATAINMMLTDWEERKEE